ncbi:hypothetical protein ACJRO7_027119 [Eucalyptus globulus]|uniref:Uncharacterized protein n=1 Tax=Eucalyptus globulus TaxID=34317 RepID=A0ABD3JRH2_EUCGL
MSGVELVAPPSATVAKSRKPVAPNDVEDTEDDLSPIEQVRFTVTDTDDPTLPVWTFRMWFLGVLSCAPFSFLNQFFAYRTEPLIIT